MSETNAPQCPHRKVLRLVLFLVGTWLAILKMLVTAGVPAWAAGLGLLGHDAARHTARLIVIGGMAVGTGLAIASQVGPWAAELTDPARTGLFMLCLALGWFLIVPLTRLATTTTLWWPLIPGAVMAANGAVVWLTGGWAQSAMNLVWPTLLVIGGFVLIIRWNRTK